MEMMLIPVSLLIPVCECLLVLLFRKQYLYCARIGTLSRPIEHSYHENALAQPSTT